MELITRSGKGSEFEWQDMDGNLNAIRDAFNSLLSAGYITQSQAQDLISSSIQSVIGSAPASLASLQQLTQEIQNDESAIAAITNALATKANSDLSNVNSLPDNVATQLKGAKGDTGATGPQGIAGPATDTLVNLTASASTTINLASGTLFKVSLGQSTTLSFTNPPASGTPLTFTIDLVIGGAYAVTWPSSVKWAGGVAPTLTGTSGKQDVFAFLTVDGGASYLGFVAGQNL